MNRFRLDDQKLTNKITSVKSFFCAKLMIGAIVLAVVLGLVSTACTSGSKTEKNSTNSSSDQANKEEQTTSTVFMVKPINFNYNDQTAQSNAFQQGNSTAGSETAKKATQESEAYVQLLRDNNVNVVYVDDTMEPNTPDSVFPNNWFSTHEDGTLVLYPMMAENRRQERKQEFLDAIKSSTNITKTVDLTHWENEGEFLEGTGSMVLDRENKIVYACLSPRTSQKVLEDFCNQMGYTPITFSAKDQNGKEIYHTNVLMCVGKDFAVICTDAITDSAEKQKVIDSLESTGKKIIDISFDQMNHFAGNMLEIKNSNNNRILVMSKTAFDSLTEEQKNQIPSDCKLICPDITCIETNGGGSARCMLAEIY